MTNTDTKNSKDNPVPDNAVWKEDSDRQFYEASVESGDTAEYHTRNDFYYLGRYIEDDILNDEDVNE